MASTNIYVGSTKIESIISGRSNAKVSKFGLKNRQTNANSLFDFKREIPAQEKIVRPILLPSTPSTSFGGSTSQVYGPVRPPSKREMLLARRKAAKAAAAARRRERHAARLLRIKYLKRRRRR